MDDELKKRAVMDAIERRGIAAFRMRDGKSTVVRVPLSDVASNGIDTMSELARISGLLSKEHKDEIEVMKVENLRTDPELLALDCIPIHELDMSSAYLKIRIKRSLISQEKLSSPVPVATVSTGNEPVLQKGRKRITLPKFPRTEWAKVKIRFLDDRNVLLSGGVDTKPSDFEALGCRDDRTGRPDDAWGFLRELAKNNGATGPRSKDERETFKKRKQKITDILRKIFQNDTDPFEIDKGVYTAKFQVELPPPEGEV